MKALEGVKVVDFGWIAEGPMICKYLGDYGADVIRIEGRTRPENMRSLGPFKDMVVDYDRSGSFNQWNTSKRSIAVNLTKTKGVEVAKRLASWADVVVENFAAGVLDKMGLGYEVLKKVNPDIILLSSTMMGQKGPNASSRGTGVTLSGFAGFHHIAGWPDSTPVSTGAITDWVAVHFNVLTILAALDYRRRTGKGQHFDNAQYENSLQFLEPYILDYTVNGRVANRNGNHHEYASPHGAYRCRGDDRWCAIGVFDDEEWNRFNCVIGDHSWAKDSRFASALGRKQNEEELDKLVESWTVDYLPEAITVMMQAAGVGAGTVENPEDIMEHDPQLKHRHFFWELDHPAAGKYRAPREGFTLSKSPCELYYAPKLGEHNEQVLKKILGMSEEEISELVIEQVIE